VNPFKRGVNRGPERLLLGTDGSAYFTGSHDTIGSFVKIR